MQHSSTVLEYEQADKQGGGRGGCRFYISPSRVRSLGIFDGSTVRDAGQHTYKLSIAQSNQISNKAVTGRTSFFPSFHLWNVKSRGLHSNFDRLLLSVSRQTWPFPLFNSFKNQFFIFSIRLS